MLSVCHWLYAGFSLGVDIGDSAHSSGDVAVQSTECALARTGCGGRVAKIAYGARQAAAVGSARDLDRGQCQ